jgi:hypothetical protein
MSIDTRLARILDTARDVVSFQPTPEQRRARANFWAHFSEGGTLLPSRPDLAIALRFAGDRRIQQWWSLPGFQDWFLNREEFKQRVEALADMALDELESLVSSRTILPSDKLRAIELSLKYASKARTEDTEERLADERIGKMTRIQLEEYIRNNIRMLPHLATQQLTLPAESDTLPPEDDK